MSSRKIYDNDRITIHHKSCTISYVIVDGCDKIIKRFIYCGPDSVDIFIAQLKKDWEEVKSERVSYPIRMTEQDFKAFHASERCNNCNREFATPLIKCKHYNHLLPGNNYISALCTRCNFAASNRYNALTIFAHNSNYDLTVLLKELTSTHNIEVISKNKLNF